MRHVSIDETNKVVDKIKSMMSVISNNKYLINKFYYNKIQQLYTLIIIV